MDRKEILSYTYRIQEYYENGLRNDGDNLLAKLIDEVKATARAEALMEARKQYMAALLDIKSDLKAPLELRGTMEQGVRSALARVEQILADKQEPPAIDSHNTLFGYPVVIDNTIPHDRLIIMTPAVFDDLKKRLEPMMPYKQDQQR